MRITSMRVCVCSDEASDIPGIGEEVNFTMDGEKHELMVTGIEAFKYDTLNTEGEPATEFSATVCLCCKDC